MNWIFPSLNSPRRRHPRVFQPLEERLFALLWELPLVRRGDVSFRIARDRVVRDEAARRGAELFDRDTVDVDELVEGYEALLDPSGVDVRFGYGRSDRIRSTPRDYPSRWLFDRGVFLRGLHPVPVDGTPGGRDRVAVASSATVTALNDVFPAVPALPLRRGKFLPRHTRSSGIRAGVARPKGDLTCEDDCKAA